MEHSRRTLSQTTGLSSLLPGPGRQPPYLMISLHLRSPLPKEVLQVRPVPLTGGKSVSYCDGPQSEKNWDEPEDPNPPNRSNYENNECSSPLCVSEASVPIYISRPAQSKTRIPDQKDR
jgi:hypothetical protein